jgi:hypothetical protein
VLFFQKGHAFWFFLKNQIQVQERFAALKLASELLFSRAKKVTKNALYVAHWATEIDLMSNHTSLWAAHHLFVCEAHPNAPLL